MKDILSFFEYKVCVDATQGFVVNPHDFLPVALPCMHTKVGPLLSHFLWKTVEFLPSLDPR